MKRGRESGGRRGDDVNRGRESGGWGGDDVRRRARESGAKGDAERRGHEPNRGEGSNVGRKSRWGPEVRQPSATVPTAASRVGARRPNLSPERWGDASAIQTLTPIASQGSLATSLTAPPTLMSRVGAVLGVGARPSRTARAELTTSEGIAQAKSPGGSWDDEELDSMGDISLADELAKIMAPPKEVVRPPPTLEKASLELEGPSEGNTAVEERVEELESAIPPLEPLSTAAELGTPPKDGTGPPPRETASTETAPLERPAPEPATRSTRRLSRLNQRRNQLRVELIRDVVQRAEAEHGSFSIDWDRYLQAVRPSQPLDSRLMRRVKHWLYLGSGLEGGVTVYSRMGVGRRARELVDLVGLDWESSRGDN